MIAKCNLCGNTFNAQRSTAKFCCDLHRTLFGKLSTEEKTEKLKQLDASIKLASEIPVPEKEHPKNSYTWVEEIENFCNQEGILPTALIAIYKDKKTTIKKYVSNSEKLNLPNSSGTSNFLSDLRKKKFGL